MGRTYDITRRIVNTYVCVQTVDEELNKITDYFFMPGMVDDSTDDGHSAIVKECTKRYGRQFKIVDTRINAGMYGMMYDDLAIHGDTLHPFRRQPWRTEDADIRKKVVDFWIRVEVQKEEEAIKEYEAHEADWKALG